MSTLKLRRGTAAQWQATNPVLAVGEPGYVTDTAVLKIGDGVTPWNSLGIVFAQTYGLLIHNLPQGGQPGQVLEVGSDGVPVWADTAGFNGGTF